MENGLSRRWFFGGAAGAAATAAAIPFVGIAHRGRTRYVNGYGIPGQRRVSCEEGDAGEVLYGSCNADQKKITVYLDDVEEKDAVTADEAKGFVKRAVRSPDGNLSVNYATNKIILETVYGKVVIDIV